MKNNILVRLNKLTIEWNKKHDSGETPFKEGEGYLFLAEIHNMPEHGIFVNREGKVLWGYHIDNFEEIPEEDT